MEVSTPLKIVKMSRKEISDQDVIADVGNYVVKQQIGSGGFSSVFLAMHKTTKVNVAIKAIEKNKMPFEVYERELRLMKMLDHPFCLSYFENFEDESFWYIVMEFVQSGTLLKEINRHNGLPEWKARHVFCQMIVALDYLHSELHIVHRDLKAENIMFDRNFNIRLIDFGLSNTFNDSALLKTACGSPAYAPPEMLCGKQYTASADIWSAGIVLYAMISGHLPFQDPNIQRLAQRIVYTDPVYPHSMSDELQDLLSRLLDKDGTTRITIPEIYRHPWFKKYPDYEKLISNFGVEQGWRSPRGQEASLEPLVVSMLQQKMIQVDPLVNDIKNNVYSSQAAAYRIMKREFITDGMFSLYEHASLEQPAKRIPLTMQVPSPALQNYSMQKDFATPSSMPRKRPSLLAPTQPSTGQRTPMQILSPSSAQPRVHRRRTASNAEAMIKDISLEKLRKEYQMQTSHIAEDPDTTISQNVDSPKDGILPSLVGPISYKRRRMSTVITLRGD